MREKTLKSKIGTRRASVCNPPRAAHQDGRLPGRRNQNRNTARIPPFKCMKTKTQNLRIQAKYHFDGLEIAEAADRIAVRRGCHELRVGSPGFQRASERLRSEAPGPIH